MRSRLVSLAVRALLKLTRTELFYDGGYSVSAYQWKNGDVGVQPIESLDDAGPFGEPATHPDVTASLKAAYPPETIAAIIGSPAPLWARINRGVTVAPSAIEVDYNASQHLPESCR